MEIWINPACSKRRAATAALDAGLLDVPKDAGHRDRWLTALVEHPQLIQRPIITAEDGTTVVARDPESLAKVVPQGPGPGLA